MSQTSTALQTINAKSTVVNGFLITNPEAEFIPALRDAIIGATFRAQGVPSFLSDEGVRIKCAKPLIFFMGHECNPLIPVWKPEAETHVEWKRKAAMALKNYAVRLSGYAHGNMRDQIQGTVMEFANAYKNATLESLKPQQGEAPAEAPAEAPTPNA